MIISSHKTIEINSPEVVSYMIQRILQDEHKFDRDKEHLWTIGLNIQSESIFIDMVHLGTMKECSVHNRAMFRVAVSRAAYALIVVHNHPHNTPVPSEADIKMTKNMINCGNILGIPLIDHVIIGDRTIDDRYYLSMCSHNPKMFSSYSQVYRKDKVGFGLLCTIMNWFR